MSGNGAGINERIMSMTPDKAHPKTVEARHEALDTHIAREAMRPGADDLEVSELKRRKLSLKDSLARTAKV